MCGIWNFPGEGLNHSCSCLPSTQQHRIWATSAIYITAHSSAGSLTHWGRPGIRPASSWIVVRFVTTQPPLKLLEMLVLVLTFASLIHIRLTLYMLLSVWLHSFVCGYPVFPAILLKRLLFAQRKVLAPLSKIIWTYMWGFISGLSFMFHWSMYLLYVSITAS